MPEPTESRWWTGDDARNFDAPDICQQHGLPLVDEWDRCLACLDEEPREDDGEAFRGDEAAAYDRERQIDAQRVK